MTMPLPTKSNTTRPRSQGLHCSINDNYYRLVSLADSTPMIRTAPLQPPRIDTSVNPEDIRPEFGTIWSLNDITGGEGLDFAHRRNATPRDPTRFWSSLGIDASPSRSGQEQVFQLTYSLNDGDIFTPPSGDFVKDMVIHTNGRAFVATQQSNNLVYVTNDVMAATPSFSSEDPGMPTADGAYSIVILGNYVYVTGGAEGVARRLVSSSAGSGSWSVWSSLDTTFLREVKGRLIGGRPSALSGGNDLYEVKDTTNSTLLHSLEQGDYFTEVIDGGTHILASASDGVVYGFTLDEDTATISLSTRNKVGSSGDTITALASHVPSGLVFYAVSRGLVSISECELYRAEINDGILVNSQLIRRFDSQVDNIHVAGDKAYIAELRGGRIWVYNLATAGLWHKTTRDSLATNNLHLSEYGDKLFWIWERTTDGPAVFRETDNRVSDGYLITPLIDHFTSAEKSWAGVSLDLRSVGGGGETVTLYYSTDPDAILDPDDASWTEVIEVTSGTVDEEIPLGVQSRYIAFKIELASSGFSLTDTPSVRSISTRAFPGPGDVVLTLPINTSDQVEAPGRARFTVPGLGRMVYETLQDIEGTSVEVELFDPNEVIQGVVEEVSSSILMPDGKGSLTLTSIVKIRGRRVSA